MPDAKSGHTLLNAPAHLGRIDAPEPEPESHVSLYGSISQQWLLKDTGHAAADHQQIAIRLNGLTSEKDAPFSGVFQKSEEPKQRRFAGPVWADDGQSLSLLDLK
jgi:hypothetical protein